MRNELRSWEVIAEHNNFGVRVPGSNVPLHGDVRYFVNAYYDKDSDVVVGMWAQEPYGAPNYVEYVGRYRYFEFSTRVSDAQLSQMSRRGELVSFNLGVLEEVRSRLLELAYEMEAREEQTTRAWKREQARIVHTRG